VKNSLTADQLARAASPEVINVHVPLEVLWDSASIDKLKKDILGKLGCLACTSGFDLRWRGARDFVVNPALQVTEMTTIGMRQG
jgi:hypothetical protein